MSLLPRDIHLIPAGNPPLNSLTCCEDYSSPHEHLSWYPLANQQQAPLSPPFNTDQSGVAPYFKIASETSNMTPPPSDHGTPPRLSDSDTSELQASALKQGVSYDSQQQIFYDQRGVPYQELLAQVLAAYRYADQAHQAQSRELRPAAASFTPINKPSPSGGVALPTDQSHPWRPTNSKIQQRALNNDAEVARPTNKSNNLPTADAAGNGATAVNNLLFPHPQSWRAPPRSTYDSPRAVHSGYRIDKTHRFNPQAYVPVSAHQRVPNNYPRKKNDAPRVPQNLPVGRLGDLTLDDLSIASSKVPPTRRERPTNRGPPAPKPTTDYLRQANLAPKLLTQPQPLLTIIDLNGTMLDRGKNRDGFVARPGAREFLAWLMDDSGSEGHKHRVMVWSSARPHNVDKMIAKLFTPDQQKQLVAVWARDTLGLTPEQYNQKVQVYKELQKVWFDARVSTTYSGHKVQIQGVKDDEQWKFAWDQSNTILIDDSWKKASSEPFNLVEIDEFENRPDQQNDAELQRVRAYISDAAKFMDVSSYMKRHPFRERTAVETGRR